MTKKPKKSAPASASPVTVEHTFSFSAPDALSVMLVGDFTDWQRTPISMHKGPDEIWTVTVKLQPGEHHYRFLVDGQWRDDPECSLSVPNPYGSRNSAIRLKKTKQV